MNISALIINVDQGQLTLPCFAREFVWRPNQVRSFFASLYHGYPIGSFVFWMPSAAAAAQLPDLPKHLPAELVVDGQQRIASIYGVVRGQLPLYYKHQEWELPPLKFNLTDESFAFGKHVDPDDPFSIDLNDCLGRKRDDRDAVHRRVFKALTGPSLYGEYMRRMLKLEGILNRNLYVERLPDDSNLRDAAEVYLTANGAGLRR